MSSIRKPLLTAIAALSTVCMAAQDGLVLRRTLEEGKTETYVATADVKQSADLPGMGDQDMSAKMEGTYLITPGKRADGADKTPIDLTYTITKMDSDGPMAAFMPQTPPGATKFKGTIDDRGRLVLESSTSAAVSNPSTIAGMSMLGATTFIELPEKAVKVGDTWKIVVPKSSSIPEDTTFTGTILAEKDIDGHAGLAVKIEGSAKMSLDLVKMMSEAGGAAPAGIDSMVVAGTMKIVSQGVIEKSTGKTLRMQSKVESDMKVEMPSRSISIPMKGTTTTEIKLQP